MLDWNKVRQEFPVTESSAYLNTAAAGPPARSAVEAATTYYQQMMNDGDVHWDEWLAKREEVRNKVATFINAEPHEIGFTTNTSSGMNLIVDALSNHGEVISCDLEFPVTTLPWMHRRIPVHLVKAIGGQVQVDHVRDAMNVRSGIISISHVQFSNGFRSNLEELGNAKGAHALVVNTSQSAGVFDIDVKRMKIDALCSTGHKWMLSGYGSGFLYLSEEVLESSKPHGIGWLSVPDPYAMKNDELHLRNDAAARAEMGCPHFAGIFALGATVEMMTRIGINNIEERALSLNRLLTERLIAAGHTVLSPIGDEQFRSAQTLVAADNPAEAVNKLAQRGVMVTEKPQGFRVATDFFNDESDIERLIVALK